MDMVVHPSALVVLIGPAGCGKSTWAGARFRDTEVVSSDRCRALVSDDPGDAAASADAFFLMHAIVRMRLKRGRLTVADATNVRPGKRAELLAIASAYRRPAVAVVFDLPVRVCVERNAGRADRVVPVAGVRAHAATLRASLPGLAEEGFAAVHLLDSPERADQTRILLAD